jgi:hypothetical protein
VIVDLRCTICGKPPGCECWIRCRCGWLYERGTVCNNAAHDEPEREEPQRVICHCAASAATRQECRAASGNRAPCRCACHSKRNRAIVESGTVPEQVSDRGHGDGRKHE